MSNQLDITFNSNSDNEPEKLKAKLSFLDPELIGKEATFTIEHHVNVNDSRPVDKSDTLFTHIFTASSTPELVTIPSNVMKERPYTYNGAKIDVECFAILKVNDKWIRSDTSTQKRLPDTNLKKPKIGGSASNLIEPKDVFSFTKNLMAIPARNKIATFGLMVIGLILIVINMILGIHDQMSSEHATILYSHYDSDGDSSTPLGKALVGCGAIGVAIWLAIKRQLRKYMTFKFRPIKGEINARKEFAVNELIKGISRTDLLNVRLRIVACNMEKGKYVRGSGSNRRTVSFSNPKRGVMLYSKKVKRIPRNEPVENHFKGSISFEPMFKALYPPNSASSSHGLFVYWEVQLIHNEFVDQELIGDTSILCNDDFFNA